MIFKFLYTKFSQFFEIYNRCHVVKEDRKCIQIMVSTPKNSSDLVNWLKKFLQFFVGMCNQ